MTKEEENTRGLGLRTYRDQCHRRGGGETAKETMCARERRCRLDVQSRSNHCDRNKHKDS